ncbi:hemolysin-iii channel protein izh2 [Diplodia corticola]|uniref:Hemolysin-iii channel protein izh2 n=1 Tax=Diplodia corticola TaxID=236234 RepID=A0A1J9RXJ4_9PEZI|nr:hemolysin-iii channel protein izh2 [Diplodia corticola]OJD37371.1 hemolysin-iii channel protein izh2 [Diplodia corticola]
MEEKTRSRPTNSSTTLLAYNELAPWQQDNEYILTSYRPLSRSYARSIRSIPTLHNQTVNIWTHLLGLVFFASLAHHLWRTLAPLYATATHEDVVVFACFFAGCFCCLACSSAYHTFMNHSENIYERWLLLDFLGILCLIAGSWVPGVYYGFYCQRADAKFYLTLILVLAAASAIVCLVPACRKPAWRPFRTGMFLALGVAGFLPMAHAARAYGVGLAHERMGWGFFALEFVLYGAGVAAYATKVPEKWAPGAFDVWGSSHQIFHVFVLLGAAAHLSGVVKAFAWNHGVGMGLC